jgi:hypothetical protein
MAVSFVSGLDRELRDEPCRIAVRTVRRGLLNVNERSGSTLLLNCFGREGFSTSIEVLGIYSPTRMKSQKITIKNQQLHAIFCHGTMRAEIIRHNIRHPGAQMVLFAGFHFTREFALQTVDNMAFFHQ